MKYMKLFLTTLKQGQLRSQRAVDRDDYECHIPEERFIPMLSRNARRETPHPGSNDFRRLLKTSYDAFLKSTEIGIKPVQVRALKEPAVNFDKVLNVTWSLPHETGLEVRNFLKSTAALSFAGPSSKNRYLEPSARPDSPPLDLGTGPSSFFETKETFIFEPIFSRRQRPRCGRAEIDDGQKARKEGDIPQSAVKTHLFGIGKDKSRTKDANASLNAKDLFALETLPPRSIAQVAPKLNLVMVDEDEGFDLVKENMKIVNGWETYVSSSPAPTSQASGSSSLTSVTTPRSSQEIDELNVPLAISSPNTDSSPIKLLEESRMEFPAMPRSKRNIFYSRSSTATKVKKIGAKQSYAAFLLGTLIKGNDHLSKDYKLQLLPVSEHSKEQGTRTEPLSASQNEMRSSPILDFDEPAMADLGDLTQAQFETGSAVKVNDNVDDTVSLAGQAGSTVFVEGTKVAERVVDVDSFESDLQAIFQDVSTEHSLGFILREKLDPMKDGKEMLMEVPKLPPPNEHPPNDVLFPVSDLRQLAVPSGSGTGASKSREKNKVYQFLKKAKGTASATLELSWVPFAVTTSLPTQEEILTVHDFIDKNTGVLNAFNRLCLSKEQGLEKIERLMEQARELCGVTECDKVTQGSNTDPAGTLGLSQIERIFAEWSTHTDQVTSIVIFQAEEGKLDIVLSRDERKRLKGLGRSEKAERAVGGIKVADQEERGCNVNARQGTAADNGHIEQVPAVNDYQIDRSYPASLLADLNVGQSFDFTPDGAIPSPIYDTELFPRTETDFGIPYYLPDDENENNIALHGGYRPPEDDLLDSTTLRYPYMNQYGYGFADEDGFDSDKENQDPSESILQLAEREWNCPGVMSEHGQGERRFPDYQQDQADDNRHAKRPRLDWEGDHRYLSQDHGGPEVDDSGIGLLDYLSRPTGPEGYDPLLDMAEDDPGDHVAYQVPSASVYRVFNDEASDATNAISTQHQLQDPDFVPLTFDSQPKPVTQSQPTLSLSAPLQACSPPRVSFSPKAGIPFAVPFHDHSSGIAEFAKLRARKLRAPPSAPEPHKLPSADVESNDGSIASKTAPESIFDRNTLRLPSSDRKLPTTAHWYMASMNLLQKQALVRSLRSEACGIGLVERDTLVDVDLIIDPHTAVIFTNLLALPSQVDTLINTICEQSWRYDNLLVVFEAFVPSMAFKPDSATSAKESLSAYSPPVLKAIRKFRRDISLAEACENKREGCRVTTAFADTVKDAAVFARIVGDEAEKRSDPAIGLWVDRAWLNDEGGEEEDNLAAADGMNHFSAGVILCQISLDEFLEISPEERVARFAPQVGHDRMVKLNGVINCGRQVMEDGEPAMMM
ncbi:hypothetical protein F5050DRAFT_762644 [Lentinula boryana]|uniref:Proteophosphoglycan ppg4 n=1 Tax=Lentinula boryana TaxID=40481 RepID=A0ABQ8Q368_9AGAR|nr:hypothetical protein F5050DRAFT_762644 [Lentinula boryana]